MPSRRRSVPSRTRTIFSSRAIRNTPHFTSSALESSGLCGLARTIEPSALTSTMALCGSGSEPTVNTTKSSANKRMHLRNFDLAQSSRAIELVGLGHRWDIHNFAKLTDVTHDSEKKTVTLEWRVPANVTSPWGDPTNHARGCKLEFSAVTTVVLGLGEKVPAGEHKVLTDVSKVDPHQGHMRALEIRRNVPFALRLSGRTHN